MKEHYELTTQPRVGPGPRDAKETTMLNRIVRWTDRGVEYEADPRQVEKLLAECGLIGANAVAADWRSLSLRTTSRWRIPSSLRSAE